MLRRLLCICFILVPIKCVSAYRGESCTVDDRPGSCKLLSKCGTLLIEIKNAGTPMPYYLRNKLQKLACGFEYKEPLVCCESFADDNFNAGAAPNENQDTTNSRPYDSNQNDQSTINYNNNDSGASKGGDNKQKPPISDITSHPNLNLLPTDCGPIEGERIFGGNRTRLFEMPWMVLLSYSSPRGTKLSCGGTLINQWYVLTAAHCVSFLGKLKLREVILGEYDVRRDPDCERIEGQQYCAPKVLNVRIGSLVAHPGYSPKNLVDDIALIRLSEPADLNLDSMKPICLPVTSELQSENLDGLQGVVAGWGATEDGLQSPVLLSVDLPIINNKECQAIYRGSPQIYESQLCAGGVPEKDSCGGDSGGPLMYPGRGKGVGVRYIQRGIVSFGSKRCGIGGYPGVYTRVAEYMKWILDNIRE